jgi:hypothetical protein
LYDPCLVLGRGRSSGVEHNLAKVGVEGSNPFARSNPKSHKQPLILTTGRQGRRHPALGKGDRAGGAKNCVSNSQTKSEAGLPALRQGDRATAERGVTRVTTRSVIAEVSQPGECHGRLHRLDEAEAQLKMEFSHPHPSAIFSAAPKHYVDDLDQVLFDYSTRANPKSNEHLKRYLRRYPAYRDDIIEFTATWRALSILDKVLPPPPPDPRGDRQILRRAKANFRALTRRRAGSRA